MSHLIKIIFLVSMVLYVRPAYAQMTATKRVPMCLQFPDKKAYVPCTGVVPADLETGNALDWKQLMKGSPSSPSSVAIVTNEQSVSANNSLPVGGKDPSGVVRTLSTDSSGALNVVCPTCTGGGGGGGTSTATETARRLFWNETNTPLNVNATFTGIARDNGGSLNGVTSRWNSFFCFAASDQPGSVVMQASNDNTSWFNVQLRALGGSGSSVYLSQPMFTKYWRCQVVNGSASQSSLVLNSGFGM